MAGEDTGKGREKGRGMGEKIKRGKGRERKWL